ncbi:hypothetical protein [Pyxidicoccus trucidator]|uniref:hypothetical protein n=1 Tax=Pyxidicoccus trucidator TaxID=2709662 RepID=UPI0013D976DF|nr:hypothetical protein [Pyxidicoccus trucidator]
MFVSRKSHWGHTTSKVLALALTLALAGCTGDDDDDDDDDDEQPNCTAGQAVTLSGKVTYDFVPAVYSASTRAGTLDFAQASAKPVRNAVVQVRQGSNVLATGATTEQGQYQLTYTPSCSGALSLVALAKTTTPDIQIEDNTDSNSVWALGDSITTTTTAKDLHAGHGWNGSGYTANRRSAAPFAILDSMYTASRAFLAVRPAAAFPALKVNWSPDNVPQGGDKAAGFISTSHFSFTENEIYILGRASIDTDEFDSHVIVHEWGHYFEANLSRSDSPGGPHSSGDVLDPRLSFGEGYGNALAAMLLPESMYVDTLWAGSSGGLTAFGFDAETAPSPTDDPTPGPFSESTVMRLLYDLYDSGSNESGYDNVALGLGPIYDVLVGPQKSTEALTTIGSFIAGLRTQAGVNETAVNALLAHYDVGPVTSGFGDGDTDLRAMYNVVPNTYPHSASVSFRGGPSTFNKQQQNRYYVFTGTGRMMNISASNASEDVGIEVYQRGEVVGSADKFLAGTESVSIPTQSGTTYVLAVMGFKENSGTYSVSISITSP